jgi:cold shock protein
MLGMAPAIWRLSQPGPATRSKIRPASAPMTRIIRKVTGGLQAHRVLLGLPAAGDPAGSAIGISTPTGYSRFSTLGDRHMALGTVKWFNAQKGYGFIQPQAGGQDVFVHISAVERAGLSSLNEGQQLEYEIVTDRGKQSAGNLKVK